ncbi:hypothetical protein CH63R_14433 [Colletotrichum higginsianum IMI 349063]|uniref:Uncharacterized protein n=1 Tax=Colletotrichum higginsianum (strain IMI 349063) TaxID=759273 RepID=A0A1B7XQT6_COLHI|nr:hypothetical protein CH63R_14433 [Colletotrichum higginsianum IMI 349063]OBR02132.1 hypothetical protein CH63R_14433 [Colletotrichum higginsianum IMI 349063]
MLLSRRAGWGLDGCHWAGVLFDRLFGDALNFDSLPATRGRYFQPAIQWVADELGFLGWPLSGLLETDLKAAMPAQPSQTLDTTCSLAVPSCLLGAIRPRMGSGDRLFDYAAHTQGHGSAYGLGTLLGLPASRTRRAGAPSTQGRIRLVRCGLGTHEACPLFQSALVLSNTAQLDWACGQRIKRPIEVDPLTGRWAPHRPRAAPPTAPARVEITILDDSEEEDSDGTATVVGGYADDASSIVELGYCAARATPPARGVWLGAAGRLARRPGLRSSSR